MAKAERRVLVVSYTFPPTGGAGVQRVAKFVKYLERFSWQPVVLTALNPSVPLTDHSLLADIPPGVAVHKAKTYEPSYSMKQGGGPSRGGIKSHVLRLVKRVAMGLLLPDAQVLWWPHLTLKARDLLRVRAVDCVFVTSPPYSVLVPVVFLAKRYGVPVIIDFRDEWTFSREQWENATKNTLSRRIDAFLEGYVLKNCTRFTAATQSYVTSILSRYPTLDPGKGCAITNGYDSEDLPEGEVVSESQQISFVYTGTVWNATSLRPFMNAVHALVEQRPELRQRLRCRIIGRVVDSELDAFSGPASDCVTFLGYVEHKEAISEMFKADVLLLSLSDLPGAGRIFPGKVFEYIATGKHVFGIVPRGETWDLLADEYRNSTLALPSQPGEVLAKLVHVIENIGEVRCRCAQDVSKYSRFQLTEQLASMFDSCVGS